MKVWIVQESCYHESEEVIGVYSTFEEAKRIAGLLYAEYPVENHVVIEATLDEAIDRTPRYDRRYSVHSHALAID